MKNYVLYRRWLAIVIAAVMVIGSLSPMSIIAEGDYTTDYVVIDVGDLPTGDDAGSDVATNEEIPSEDGTYSDDDPSVEEYPSYEDYPLNEGYPSSEDYPSYEEEPTEVEEPSQDVVLSPGGNISGGYALNDAAVFAIDAADGFIAGEAFEFVVTVKMDGLLQVSLAEQVLVDENVFSGQEVTVRVEEMPVEKASFDIVLIPFVIAPVFETFVVFEMVLVETELVIDAADSYVAGEAFEFEVTASADGLLSVYMNDVRLFAEYVTAEEAMTIHAEDMPEGMATFDVMLAGAAGYDDAAETVVVFEAFVSAEITPLALAPGEVMWYSAVFTMPDPPAGITGTAYYLNANPNAIVTRHADAVAAGFDFSILRNGGNFQNHTVGGVGFTLGGGLPNNARHFFTTATLPTLTDSFRIEIDFKSGNADPRTISFVEHENTGNVIVSAFPALASANGSAANYTTLTHTFSAGAVTPRLEMFASGDVRIFAIRIIRLAGGTAPRVEVANATVELEETGDTTVDLTITTANIDAGTYAASVTTTAGTALAGVTTPANVTVETDGSATLELTVADNTVVDTHNMRLTLTVASDPVVGNFTLTVDPPFAPREFPVPTQSVGRTGTRIHFDQPGTTTPFRVGSSANQAPAPNLVASMPIGGYYRNVEFIAYKFVAASSRVDAWQSFTLELSNGSAVALRTRTGNDASNGNYSHITHGFSPTLANALTLGGGGNGFTNVVPNDNNGLAPLSWLNNPSHTPEQANEYRIIADIDGTTLTYSIMINDHVAVNNTIATVPMGTHIVAVYAGTRTDSSMYIPAWALYGTSGQQILAPDLSISGITGGAHDFGTVTHNNRNNFTAQAVTLRNNGTAPAENLSITLTSGETSFVITGTIPTSLDDSDEITFNVAPRAGLPDRLHTGTVTIAATGTQPITFNVSFNITPQAMDATWNQAYLFDFARMPTDGTQLTASIANQASTPIVNRDPSGAFGVRTVASTARVQDFQWLVGAGAVNQGFRQNGSPPNNFIDPNGAGRWLGTSHALQAPIRIVVDAIAEGTNAGGRATTLTVNFGEQTFSAPVTGDRANPTRVTIEFAAGEGYLDIPFPWGPDGSTDPTSRLGIRAISIYEGAFDGPWLSEPIGFEFDFPRLLYRYDAADLVTRYVDITNIGSAQTSVSASIGAGFTITQPPASTLAAGASTTIGIRPNTDLPSGLHTYGLEVSASPGNTIIIPASIRVANPIGLPNGVTLFYTGTGTSNASQFPNNANEVANWEHAFRRVVFSEGSHLISVNGQLRDSNHSLAIPFMLNDLLWVPLEAAQLALPNLTWDVDFIEESLTVTSGATSYTTYVPVATQALNGGDAVFVPLQTIASALNIGNIGWDTRSNTLIITTGVAVEQGNVLYNNINNRHEAWYGSPNSLAIATNFVYMQRTNGGWPRGIGQTNALPHQPDVGGMSEVAVADVAASRNAIDSYFGRGITTNETRFLLRMYEATGIERFYTAGRLGFDTIVGVQDPLGGWPYQISGGSYHRGLSISDNAIDNILWLLMDIEDGLYADTLGSAGVAQASNALEKGIRWILNTQVRSSAFADGVERLTAWPFMVYQSGVENFTLQTGATAGIPGQPAWAREFEPPSISADESVDIIEFLMSIPNPSQEIIDAVSAAVFFYEYIRIDGFRLHHNPIVPGTTMHPQLGRWLDPEEGARPLWPRFTCIDTFMPLFYDRAEPGANDALSPHQGVSRAAFEAAHGSMLGLHSTFVSANATQGPGNTSANRVRAGTRRNVFRDASGNLSINGTPDQFDLAASFHGLTHERRMGYNYINHFGEGLSDEYAAWRVRIGLDDGPTDPTEDPTDSTEDSTDSTEDSTDSTEDSTDSTDSTSPTDPPLPPPSTPDSGDTVTDPSQSNATRQVNVPVNNYVDINVRVQNNRATLNLNTPTVREIIASADEERGVAYFDLSTLEITSVAFPRAAIRQLADADLGVELILPQGTITLDAEATYFLGQAARSGSISFQIAEIEHANLPEALLAQIDTTHAVHEVSITAGNQVIVNFDGTITISLPYEGQSPVTVWIVDEEGNLQLVELDAEFDAEAGLITFTTDTIGMFVIGYNAETQPYQTPVTLPAQIDQLPEPAAPTTPTLRLVMDSTEFSNNGVAGQVATAPFIDPETDRAMMPLRLIAESLGAEVNWNDETRTVIINTLDGEITLVIDQPLPGDMGAAMIVNDLTFVPVRFVAEALGVTVEWDEATRAVNIVM